MKTSRGMTLVELVIVMAIISILSAIALSAYRRYVVRANRSEAWQTLLQLQSGEEKFFLQSNTYTTDLTDPPPAGLGLPITAAGNTTNNYYSITIATTACTTGTGQCAYTATATAINGQASDTAACQTYTINSLGQRTPADSSGCWH